ncbi:MAG TPA: hypothetical protein PKM63_20050 [Panacibacter sp.]|nr:hypothetical protein [Panacibacter sp.]HNP46600.1 hypothetical protein [Panacibacter sp.]
MKKMLTPLFLLLFFAASAQLTKDDVNLVQSIYGKDKRDLMEQYMSFSDAAKAKVFLETI